MESWVGTKHCRKCSFTWWSVAEPVFKRIFATFQFSNWSQQFFKCNTVIYILLQSKNISIQFKIGS